MSSKGNKGWTTFPGQGTGPQVIRVGLSEEWEGSKKANWGRRGSDKQEQLNLGFLLQAGSQGSSSFLEPLARPGVQRRGSALRFYGPQVPPLNNTRWCESFHPLHGGESIAPPPQKAPQNTKEPRFPHLRNGRSKAHHTGRLEG